MIDVHDAVEKTQILLRQGRFALAEKQMREALGQFPGDPVCLAMLSQAVAGQNRSEEALEIAEQAIVQGPQLRLTHMVLGSRLAQVGRSEEALRRFDEAARLDPNNAPVHAARARTLLQLDRTEEALAACDYGLSLDPDDSGCLEVRVRCLRKLGRNEEATQAAQRALQSDPHQAVLLTYEGWAKLRAGRTHEAAHDFREALRLEPGLEEARAGLVQALRARNPLYRFILRYYVWSASLGQFGSILLIVGILGAQFILRVIPPPLGPILLLALVGFILLTWLAKPLSDLSLMFHRDGRLSLREDDRRGALLFAGMLALCTTMVVGALITGDERMRTTGFLFGLQLLPISMIYNRRRGWPRIVMVVVNIIIFLMIIRGVISNDWELVRTGGQLCFLSTFLGAFLPQSGDRIIST